MITEENKQEAAWQYGALVKLICVVTVKPISSDVSKKLYCARIMWYVNFKC